MQKIKTHYWFWITSIFFLVLTFLYWFISATSAIDINFHDTYFVMASFDITVILVVLYSIAGLIYWLFSKFKVSTNRILSKIHTIITIGSILIYYVGYYIIESRPKSEFPLFDDGSLSIMTFKTILIFIVLVTQLLFLANIITSLTKHGIQRTTRK